jgi:hypothetical protein
MSKFKLIKQVFMIALFSKYSLLGFAQPGWNYIPPIPTTNIQTFSMATNATKDKIILCSVGFDTLSRQSIILTQLDTLGNIENNIYLIDSLGGHMSYTESFGGLISTADGGYWLNATTVERKNINIFKFDADLNELFRHELFDTLVKDNFIYHSVETTNGYLLHGTSYFLSSNKYKGIIRQLDKEGNELWKKKFDHTNYINTIVDLKPLTDSTYLVATVESLTPFNSSVFESGRSAIYHIDQQGNILDSMQTQAEPEIGYLRNLLVLNDTSFIVSGLAFREAIGTDKLVQKVLTCMNTKYEILWQDTLGARQSLGAAEEFKDFLKVSQTSVFGIGSLVSQTRDTLLGWAYKFDTGGNNQTSFTYGNPLGGGFAHQSFLYSMDTLASGNIVVAGIVTDTTRWHSWVVKFTQDGCMDTLWCSSSPTDTPQSLESKNQINAFPNPTSQTITLDLNGISRQGKNILIKAINLQGNVVLSLETNDFEPKVDFSAFSSGVYYMQIYTEQGVYWSEVVKI